MRLPFLALAGALALACVGPADAQTYRVVGSCGAQSLRVGDGSAAFLDATGNLCTAGGSGGAGASTADTRASNTLAASSTSSSIVVPVNGQQTLGLTFTGLTASGATVSFSQSIDGGTTYTTVNEVNTGTGVATSTRTTDGQSRIDTAGRTNIKIQVTAAGTGTITVASNLSYGQAYAALASPLPPGTNPLGSVLSDLRVAGAAVAAGNPIPVTIGNFPGSQAVTNAGTFPVQNTAATPAGGNVIGFTTLRSAGTNRSASVTTTAANLMAANASRQGWKIKNDCSVAVWINFDATATAAAGSGNIQVPAGAYMASEPGFVETGAMSAIAASGTCALTAREH